MKNIVEWLNRIRDLPHDSVNHFIDDFINDDKEVNDSFSCLSEGSKYSSERETKEDYSKGVCSRSRVKSVYILCMLVKNHVL